MSGFPDGYEPSADEVRNQTDLAAGDLYQLAVQHPHLRPAIAEHPNCYPALLEWLRGQNDPDIQAALARREHGESDGANATAGSERADRDTATAADQPAHLADSSESEGDTPIFGASPTLNASADLASSETATPAAGEEVATSPFERSPDSVAERGEEAGSDEPGEEAGPLTAPRVSDDESASEQDQELDPNATASELHQLAASKPHLHAAIAAHPNAYPDLLKWLASLGNPEVIAAIEAREEQPSAETTEIFPAVAADNAPGAGASDRWTYGQEDYVLAGNNQVDSYHPGQVAQQPAPAYATQQYQSAPLPGAMAQAQYPAQAPMPSGYTPAPAPQPPAASGGVGRSILLGILIGLLLVGAAIAVLWWAPWESKDDALPAASPTTSVAATESEASPTPTEAGEPPKPDPTESAVDKSEYLPANAPRVQSLQSPTGNIACEAQSDTDWVCTIFEHDFSSALGVDCDGPFSIRFNQDGEPSGVCDAVVYSGDEVVDYDNTVQLGEVAGCLSKLDGMRCWDGASNTGFNIAREGIDPYSS